MNNEDRFLELNSAISRAYNADNYAAARSLIKEYLLLSEDYKNHWNYPNAIHQIHTYEGLMALQEGRLESAKSHLLNSAPDKGSPQIKSFGPNMLLANKLLHAGERQVVLEYLQNCKRSWMLVMRFNKLRKWRKNIKNGLAVNFGANLKYHLA